MVYALHAVIITNTPLEKAKKIALDIIKDDNKKFYRVTESGSIRFRNYPKTYFNPKSFRSKITNENITLVFGELLPKYKHLK